MVTSFYAAILALLFVALSVYVILGRAKHRVLVGEGTSPDMLRRIRAHANFIEYTPLFLILLLLVEQQTEWAATYLHIIGAAFVLGRLAHAYALTRAEGVNATAPSVFRLIGMICTFTPLVVLAVGLLFQSF